MLGELAVRLEDGRIYDRDLIPLAEALAPVLDAYEMRFKRSGLRAHRAL